MGDGNADVVDVRRLSLIDVSFEDDRLVETSPARPAGPQFFDDQSLEPLRGVDPYKQEKKMASENLESFEEQANKTPEHYHLRESLAWDSAFFTSDGVLEPEELTSMIEDAEKKEKRTLPVILEESQRSTESISTLASDTLTLTSLEGEELFEDIRASIQKSSKTSNLHTFGGKAGQSLFEARVHHALRKTETDPASHGKLKPKPAPKKSSLGMIRPRKTANQASVHRRVSQVRSEALGGGSNSSPSKPPKLGILNPTPSSTKRECMGVNHTKPEKNNIGGGTITRGASEPKVPVSGGTRSIVPKPTSSRSSSARATSVETPQSDSSASGFSDKTGKSPTNLRSKGVGSRSRNLSSASSFTQKTPLRSTPSCLSAHLVSTTKLSSSISPTFSISEWSSESSSSPSAVKQRSYDSRASLEPSSSEKTCDDGDNRQQLGGPKTHGSAGSTQRLKNASARGNLLPNSIGPSGLRMPSPKIGFFDGTKSGQAPNAKRQHQRVVPCALPEVGTEISRPDGSTNRVKGVKCQPARNASAIGRTIGDSKHSSSRVNQKSPPP